MRDIVLIGAMTVLVFGGLPHPWIGIMGWTWISLMNPHRVSWHLADKPVALIFALVTFIGLVVTKDKRRIFVTPETAVLMLLMLWMTFVYVFFALYPYDCDEMWRRVMKIDLMVLVSLVVLHSRKHLVAFIWVIAVSIGFYGFKGGIFTIMTGGSYRVWGPDGSFIDGNNEVALALIIIIPLIRFLALQVTSSKLRKFLYLWMLLCVAAALGSQSRGALVAIVAMGLVMWMRSEKKVASGFAMIVVAAAFLAFMPQSWSDRMNTTTSYEQDGSAMGRINAWVMAWNLVKDHPTGGSFSVAMPGTFAQYAPNPLDIHAAHSIYFQILGEQGYLGFVLFMTLWIMVWNSAGRIRREGRKRPETQWLSDLGAMCQVSLAGYAVGGAFLSLAYFDLPYNIMIIVIIARNWIKDKAWEHEEPLTGRWAPYYATLGMGHP